MIDIADMPEEVLAAFECYLDGAGRNVSEVARQRGIPRITVQKWSERHRWVDRAAALDADTARGAITHARAQHAGRLAAAGAVFDAALASRIGADGKPKPGSPTPVALRAAVAVYEHHGISPVRQVRLELDAMLPRSRLTRAEVQAMVARGDMAALLALDAGEPIPPPPAAPPPDFTDTQPGGRGVPGSPFAEPHDAVLDAAFHPNGGGDDRE